MFPVTLASYVWLALPPYQSAHFNGLMSPALTGTATFEQHCHTAASTTADDGLSAVAAPIWQIVIGGCVLVSLVAASARLARRGRSRMTTALLITGAAAVSLAVISVLTSAR